jgi:hypothetical protein
MPWNNKTGYEFSETSINANAPAASGVYGLFKGQQWVYFGESESIQRRLLEHLRAPTPCMAQQRPTHFSFELHAGLPRVSRQDALIVEFRPPCNQKLG